MRVAWMGLLAIGLGSTQVAAQELDKKVAADVTDETVLARDDERKDGWKLKLKLGGTGAYNHSKSVVGSVDGSSVQLGLLLDGSAELVSGQHSWESILQIKENQTRTPQIESFIKSADELLFASTYTYTLAGLDWLGFFGRGRLTTQLFHGYDIRAEPVTIIRNLRDGTQTTKAVASQTRFALTKPFEPMFLKESLGVVAKPVSEDAITFKAKVGGGLQHILVGDGFTLAEDRETELEFNQLDDSTEAGALVDLDANGKLAENITWNASASFFYPLAGGSADLEGLAVVSSELGAKLSVKLVEWASLDYVLSAKYLPQIIDEWQIANGVTVTLGYDLI